MKADGKGTLVGAMLPCQCFELLLVWHNPMVSGPQFYFPGELLVIALNIFMIIQSKPLSVEPLLWLPGNIAQIVAQRTVSSL